MRLSRCLGVFHRYREERQEPTGYATLSWTARPVREYQAVECCALCGKERLRGGYYHPFDRARHPEAYGADGWPLTAAGQRMPIRDAIQTGI